MKVSGTRSTSSSSGVRGAAKTGGDSGAFKSALVDAMDSSPGVASADGLSALGGVGALLLAQGVDASPDREQRRRMIQHGEDILDMLEELRHGLLLGTIPADKLDRLIGVLRNKRESCADPRLAALLDEIELRAEVELAKLGR